MKLQIARCRLRGARGVVLLAWLASACGAAPERAIVDEFFAESRLRDKTALQQTATVIFEPRVNGIVERFEITKVSPEADNSKSVTVSASVELPDGTRAQKNIVLVMTRRKIAGTDGAAAPERWIITGFMDAAAPAAAPRS